MKQVSRMPLALAAVLVATATAEAQVGYTYTTITVPGAVETEPADINAAGQVVGFYTDPGVNLHEHGFVGSPGGGYTAIDVPGASTFTGAGGVNEAGQVVGNSSNGQGFLLTGATFTPITVPGASLTAADAINNSGEIVGVWSPGSFSHGFFRSTAGSYSTFDVPGAINTVPSGVNDTGQVAGDYQADDSRFHGFLRSAAGDFTTIDVPGAIDTFIDGMNNTGQFVGAFTDAASTQHGFLWNNDVVTTIDFPGALLGGTEATGINDAGQIVGTYLVDQGGMLVNRGFLATPVPEPVAVVLFSIGLVASAFRSRHRAG